MRLSEVISKSLSDDFVQVEGFLGDKRCKPNTHKNITVGQVRRNFFCAKCNDTLTFLSGEKISCVVVSNQIVSIDCILECCICHSGVPIWALVECDNDIFFPNPKVRMIKYCEELLDKASWNKDEYGNFSELLYKSERAYHEKLGAGSVIYLRKIYELIIKNMADLEGIDTNNSNGKRKLFKDLLKEVDKKCSIVPKEFSDDGYKLFSDLSSVLHGGYEEELGLQKYEAFRRLVCGIISNIRNNKELMSAIGSLGWNEKE